MGMENLNFSNMKERLYAYFADPAKFLINSVQSVQSVGPGPARHLTINEPGLTVHDCLGPRFRTR